jgi:solute:Na+ symporter, SSS family
MLLKSVDWVIVFVYLALSLGVGLYFARRAGKSVEDFFLSGRRLSWWLAGTSIAAAAFASDTPIAVTEYVRQYGIAGNWFKWSFSLTGLSAVYLFSVYWRRSNFVTDVEFVEARYEGRPAAALRGFMALFYGVIFNCIEMGWIISGMTTVVGVTTGLNRWATIVILLGIATLYTTKSGLWGVVTTDFMQFFVATAGSILLAWYAIRGLGGIAAIKAALAASGQLDKLQMVPTRDSTWMPLPTFLVYVLVLWWSTDRADGTGYYVQRILSTRNEKQAFLSGIWFSILTYSLLPWLWIVVGVASLVAFPGLTEHYLAYPKMLVQFAPTGVRGLMVAGFFAAFMATTTSHLNWGASYLCNDLYRRFIRRSESQSHYVFVSKLFTLFLVVAGGVTGYYMHSIQQAWEMQAAMMAGTGSVFVLRWLWWRVNAWSEISALTTAVTVSIALAYTGYSFPTRILISTAICTIIWIGVTLLTAPVSDARLIQFYRRVRPGGRLWRRIAQLSGTDTGRGELGRNLVIFAFGTAFTFLSIFCIGEMVFFSFWKGFGYLAGAAVAAYIVFLLVRDTFREMQAMQDRGSAGNSEAGS